MLQGESETIGQLELYRPLEAIENLQLLDRVALDAGAQTPSHDCQKVHESLTPEQPVDVVFASSEGPMRRLSVAGL